MYIYCPRCASTKYREMRAHVVIEILCDVIFHACVQQVFDTLIQYFLFHRDMIVFCLTGIDYCVHARLKIIYSHYDIVTRNNFRRPFVWGIYRFPVDELHVHVTTLMSEKSDVTWAWGSLVGYIFMMMSSNGNIFRVTGHLCGEFTGPRWIPHTKASDAELWCLLWSALG